MIIDLSAAINEEQSGRSKTKIKRVPPHKTGYYTGGMYVFQKGLSRIQFFIRALLYVTRIKALSGKDFMNNRGLTIQFISTSTHSGTHLDAPMHMGYQHNGSGEYSIDKVPLEWCYNDGVLLDFSKNAPRTITVEHIEEKLKETNTKLKPFDIVIFNTGASEYRSTDRYFEDYPAISPDSVTYLYEKGIRIFGTDAWGIDPPGAPEISKYLKSNRKGNLFPAHMKGMKLDIIHMEQMSNLNQIPNNQKFKVACFPVKILGGDAAWCRAVAITN